MRGFSLRERSTLRAVLAIVAIIAVAIVVGRAVQSPGPTPEPGSSSALEACQLPASDLKAGGAAYQWQVAVRLDSPQQSAILFTSGRNVAQCEAYRGPDGTFNGSSIGVGIFEPQSGTALTYDTGGVANGTYSNQLVIGQVPLGTASIDVLTSDGEHHSAAIGNGWYMAWATTTGQSDRVVEIDALDSAGKIIANMGDPSGLRAGTTEEPFSS
jgi:hypothetical protein